MCPQTSNGIICIYSCGKLCYFFEPCLKGLASSARSAVVCLPLLAFSVAALPAINCSQLLALPHCLQTTGPTTTAQRMLVSTEPWASASPPRMQSLCRCLCRVDARASGEHTVFNAFTRQRYSQVELSACVWAGRLSVRQASVRIAAQSAAAEVSAEAIAGALSKHRTVYCSATSSKWLA